jgi:hypothetical protein
MYTTLKIISRKFLGVSLIWTFFSHVGVIFYEKTLLLIKQQKWLSEFSVKIDRVASIN